MKISLHTLPGHTYMELSERDNYFSPIKCYQCQQKSISDVSVLNTYPSCPREDTLGLHFAESFHQNTAFIFLQACYIYCGCFNKHKI